MTEKSIKQFETGKQYRMNSICDSECWWYYIVVSRTKCTVTLRQLHADGTPYNETKTCRIEKNSTEFYGAEAVSPLGKYSMSPTLTAEKIYEPEQPKAEPKQLALDFDTPAEAQEAPKAVTLPLGNHGTLIIGGVPVVSYNTTDATEEAEPATSTVNTDLSDLKQKAERAHYWSSFDPERAGRVELEGWQATLNADLQEIPESRYEEYVTKFREKLADILVKESRIASAMVTGPAKFPTEKNQRAINAHENALRDFEAWRKKILNRIKRLEREARPQAEKDAEEWAKVRRDIIETARSLKAIDEEGAPYHRPLFVSSLFGKMERLANNGKTELLRKASELITTFNDSMKKPIFTKRHQFWTLVEKSQQAAAKAEETAHTESATIQGDGYDIVKNYAADRLQIIFAEIPSTDMRSTLKSNGFRWSPRFKAWQRQLTSNAEYAAARALGKTRQEIFA